MNTTDALSTVLDRIVGKRIRGGARYDPVSGRTDTLPISLDDDWTIVAEARCTILGSDGALDYATGDDEHSDRYRAAMTMIGYSTVIAATVDETALALAFDNGATLIVDPAETPAYYASAWWIGSPAFGRILARPDGRIASAPWPVTGIRALIELVDHGRLPQIDGPPDGRLCIVLQRGHLIAALERGRDDPEHLRAWARVVDSFDSLAIWYERDAQAQIRIILRHLARPDPPPPARAEIDALIADLAAAPGGDETGQTRLSLPQRVISALLLAAIHVLVILAALAAVSP